MVCKIPHVKAPMLILLPGMDGTGKLFAPFINALPAGSLHHTVAYPRDRPAGYEELLPLVRSALPEDDQFVIVAESFSGPLAIMIASERPRGLEAVVLCASFVRNPLPVSATVAELCVRESAIRLIPMRLLARLLIGKTAGVDLKQSLEEAVASNAPSVFTRRMRAILQVDVRKQLQQCPVPLLYIRGTHDRVVRRRNVKDVRSAYHAAKVIDVAAPHLVLQTQPKATVEAIFSFLAVTAFPA